MPENCKSVWSNRSLVCRSWQLKREKGILADPDPKSGGKKLSEGAKEQIMKFYQSKENSHTCPGKKEFLRRMVKRYINKNTYCL